MAKLHKFDVNNLIFDVKQLNFGRKWLIFYIIGLLAYSMSLNRLFESENANLKFLITLSVLR